MQNDGGLSTPSFRVLDVTRRIRGHAGAWPSVVCEAGGKLSLLTLVATNPNVIAVTPPPARADAISPPPTAPETPPVTVAPATTTPAYTTASPGASTPADTTAAPRTTTVKAAPAAAKAAPATAEAASPANIDHE